MSTQQASSHDECLPRSLPRRSKKGETDVLSVAEVTPVVVGSRPKHIGAELIPKAVTGLPSSLSTIAPGHGAGSANDGNPGTYAQTRAQASPYWFVKLPDPVTIRGGAWPVVASAAAA